MTVKRLHELACHSRSQGRFLYLRGNCCITHRTYCQERPGVVAVGGKKTQKSVSDEGLLDYKIMIVNKDLTDILYSSKCLESQMFCINLSLFTD